MNIKESIYLFGFIDGLLWVAEYSDVIAHLKQGPLAEGRARKITEKLNKQATTGGFILPNAEREAN